MSLNIKNGQSTSVCGLGTWTYVLGSTAQHFASIVSTELPPSALSIVINKNGSPIASSSSPAASQQTLNCQALINGTSGDTITFVISSSNVNDEQLNTVKSQLIIRVGN